MVTQMVRRLGNGGRRLVRFRSLGASRAVLLVGVVLIAAQIAGRAGVVAKSFFTGDDYILLVRATEQNLDWGYLFTPHAGRWTPGGLGLAWLLARAGTYHWALVAGVILAIQALASLAVLRMLTVVFGRRPATLLPFAVYLVSPLALAALTWWSAALTTVVPQIAVAMAVTSHVLYQRDGRRIHAVAAILWILTGTFFSLGVALLPLLLFGLTAVWFTEGWGMSAVRQALRAAPVLWTVYASIVLGGGGVHLATRPPQAEWLPGPAAVAGFLWRLIGQTLVTGLVGGPVRWYFARSDYGVALPPAALVVAAWVVVALAVVITVRARRHAAAAWLLLLGYVIVTVAVPTLPDVVQAGEFRGARSELLAGAVPVITLLLGLAFLPLMGEEQPYLRRLPLARALAGVTVLAVVALSAWSSSAYASSLRTQPMRDYLATAARELARTPSSVQIYDTTVPGRLLSAWLGEYRSTARILGPLAGPDLRDVMRHPGPTADAMVFDATGQLRPMAVSAVVVATPKAKPVCYPLSGGRVDVPLSYDLPRRKYTVVLSYTATREALAVFAYGGARVPINLAKGVHVLYLQVVAGGPALRIDSLSPGAGLCVSAVRIGAPVPRVP